MAISFPEPAILLVYAKVQDVTWPLLIKTRAGSESEIGTMVKCLKMNTGLEKIAIGRV